jgi:hypothetical protein
MGDRHCDDNPDENPNTYEFNSPNQTRSGMRNSRPFVKIGNSL